MDSEDDPGLQRLHQKVSDSTLHIDGEGNIIIASQLNVTVILETLELGRKLYMQHKGFLTRYSLLNKQQKIRNSFRHFLCN